MKIILASKSPRRKELLSKLVSDFDIITSDADETMPEGMHPKDGVRLLAERKGEVVLPLAPSDALIISSDTLVELDGVALGKPKDESDAENMLLSLSDREHNVHTGVAVHYKGRVYSGVDSCAVRFKKMTLDEARDYVKTGEPMDKAGSYAIQGLGARFVEGYRGDYNAIVGLGLNLTEALINEALKNDR